MEQTKPTTPDTKTGTSVQPSQQQKVNDPQDQGNKKTNQPNPSENPGSGNQGQGQGNVSKGL